MSKIDDLFALLLLSVKGFESSEDIIISSKILADNPCIGDEGGVGEAELSTETSISVVFGVVMVLVLMLWIMAETDIGGEAGGLDHRGSADAGLRDISIQIEPGGLPKSLSNRLELDFLLNLNSLWKTLFLLYSLILEH